MNKLSLLANQTNSLHFDSCRMLQAGKEALVGPMKKTPRTDAEGNSWMDHVGKTLDSATNRFR